MPHLSAFEAGVVSGARGRLSNAVSHCSPLSSPLVRGPSAAEVHWYRTVVKGRGCCRRIYGRGPVPDGVSVSGGVGGSPSPHVLLGTLEELLRRLPSLLGCVSPVSGIRPSLVALVAKHTLNNLTRSRSIDRFLLHLFVASGERGFHHLCGDGAGESS